MGASPTSATIGESYNGSTRGFELLSGGPIPSSPTYVDRGVNGSTTDCDSVGTSSNLVGHPIDDW